MGDNERDTKIADKAEAAAKVKLAEEAAAKKDAEDKKAADGPIYIEGLAGEVFNVRGDGFGASGSMTVGGTPVKITRWDDKNIRGTLPADAKGAVSINGKDRGVFPPVRPTQLPATTPEPKK